MHICFSRIIMSFRKTSILCHSIILFRLQRISVWSRNCSCRSCLLCSQSVQSGQFTLVWLWFPVWWSSQFHPFKRYRLLFWWKVSTISYLQYVFPSLQSLRFSIETFSVTNEQNTLANWDVKLRNYLIKEYARNSSKQRDGMRRVSLHYMNIYIICMWF